LANTFTILEAAQRLGVSPDTVRRRVKSGELPAHQKKRGQGFQWLVDLASFPEAPEEDARPGPADHRPAAPQPRAQQGVQAAPTDTGLLEALVAELRGTLQVTRAELEARRREVDRLLTLLEKTQE
jgi:excisionase family DNA binding protein